MNNNARERNLNTKLSFTRRTALSAAAVLIFACSSAIAGHSPIPDQWHRSFRTPIEPVRTYFFGPISKISISNGKKGAPAETGYTVWGKVEYKRLQGAGRQYMTDILQLQVNCSASSVSTLREVKLGQSGNTVSDVSNPAGAHVFDADDDENLGRLPVDTGLAIGTWELTCDSK